MLALYETVGFQIGDGNQGSTGGSVRPEAECYIVLEPVGDILWRRVSRRVENLRYEAREALVELSAHYD